MTTNHRPTLESKRGRANAIKDTIQHSRSLNGQLSLKLRLDVKGTKFDPAKGKRALDELNSESKRAKIADGAESEDVKAKENSDVSDENHNNEPNDLNSASESKDETNEQDGASSEESEYESEDEDEEAALMAELAKIKREKEELQKKDKALAGNPLIDTNGNDKTTKKSWRTSSPFGNKSATAKQSKFTTNTLESETHRKFLTKYFR